MFLKHLISMDIGITVYSSMCGWRKCQRPTRSRNKVSCRCSGCIAYCDHWCTDVQFTTDGNWRNMVDA